MNRQKNSTNRGKLIDRCTVLKLGSSAALLGLAGNGAHGLSTRGSTLIRNTHVLTMGSSVGDIPSADILIEDGQIVAIGKSLRATAERRGT